MLNAIQKNDDGTLSLLIEIDVLDGDGDFLGRLPEVAYSISAVPSGSLKDSEIAWVKKMYPNAVIVFV